VTVALGITFIVLIFGGRVERRLHRTLGGKETPEQKSAPTDAAPT
jgi:hypothetical protein